MVFMTARGRDDQNPYQSPGNPWDRIKIAGIKLKPTLLQAILIIINVAVFLISMLLDNGSVRDHSTF